MPKTDHWSLIIVSSIDLHLTSAVLFLQFLGLTLEFLVQALSALHRSFLIYPKLFLFTVAAFANACSPVCLNASPFAAPLYINSCITETIHPHMALCQSQLKSQRLGDRDCAPACQISELAIKSEKRLPASSGTCNCSCRSFLAACHAPKRPPARCLYSGQRFVTAVRRCRQFFFFPLFFFWNSCDTRWRWRGDRWSLIVDVDVDLRRNRMQQTSFKNLFLYNLVTFCCCCCCW